MAIVGVDLFNLVMFITSWPDATLLEMAVSIYNEGGNLYFTQEISKRLAELEFTKKKTSVEGYQTQQPDVQFRVWGFWNRPPPLGIFEVLWRKLINVDEVGVSLEKCNHMGGWAIKEFCVQKDGHYHHDIKMTVIFAIEPGDPDLPMNICGSLDRPWHWIRCLHAAGTTANIFGDFCDYVCWDIHTNNIPGTVTHRVFIWDNLAVHHSTYVYTTVMNRDGGSIFSIVA